MSFDYESVGHDSLFGKLFIVTQCCRIAYLSYCSLTFELSVGEGMALILESPRRKKCGNSQLEALGNLS